MIDIISKTLVSGGFVFFYSAMIIAVFTVSLVVCLLQRRRLAVRLSEGVRTLENGFERDGGVSRPVHFAGSFPDISEGLTGNRMLADAWAELRGSLIPPGRDPNDPDSGCYRSAFGADAFFNDESIVQPFYSERIYSALPNYLTGIGILGTFLGLAAGIHLADFRELSAMVAPDGENFAKSLGPLLGGAGLAFVTSVVGLALSIAFSAVEKVAYDRITLGLNAFCRLLNASVVRLTPEVMTKRLLDLFQEHKDASKAALKEQTKQQSDIEKTIGTFTRAFRQEVADALRENVTEPIGKGLSDIGGILREMHDHRSQQISAALKSMVDSFLEGLTETTRSVAHDMWVGFREIADQCPPLAEKLGAANDAVGKHLEAASDVVSELRDTVDALTMATRTTSDTLTDAARGATSAASAAEMAAREAAEAARRAAESYDELYKRLHDTSERWLGALHDVAELFRTQILDSFQGVNERIDAVGSHAGELIIGMKEVVERSADTAVQVITDAGGRVSGDAQLRIGQVGQELAEIVAGLERHQDSLFGRAGERADGFFRNLAEAICGVPAEDGAEGDQNLSARFGAVIERLGQGLNQSLDDFGTAQRAQFEAISGRIADEAEKIAKAMTEVPEAQRIAYEKILASLREYNEHFRAILDSVSGGEGGLLGRLREGVGAVYDDISGKYKEITEGFTRSTEQISANAISFIEKHDREAGRLWETQKEATDALVLAFADLRKKFLDRMADFENCNQQLGEVYGEHLKSVKDSAEAIRGILNGIGIGPGGLDEALSQTLKRLQDSYLLNIDRAEKFLREIDDSYAKSMSALRKAAGEITFAVQQAQEFRERGR